MQRDAAREPRLPYLQMDGHGWRRATESRSRTSEMMGDGRCESKSGCRQLRDAANGRCQ